MKKEVSLDELNAVYHTEINYDGFILPIKIDISNITSEDYAMAFSFCNQFKKKSIDAQQKEQSELDNIKIVNIEGDKFTLSYQKLTYEYELELIEQDKKLNYIFKFINVYDKLFDEGTKTLLEYLGYEDIKTWLFDTGFNDNVFSEMYKVISYWLELLIVEFHAQTKVALLLTDENGTSINYNLARLKSCYENMSMYYFKENSNVKSYEELSYREQHLMQSYYTKMHYIEVSINKTTKKEFEESKNKINSPQKKTSSYARK